MSSLQVDIIIEELPPPLDKYKELLSTFAEVNNIDDSFETIFSNIMEDEEDPLLKSKTVAKVEVCYNSTSNQQRKVDRKYSCQKLAPFGKITMIKYYVTADSPPLPSDASQDKVHPMFRQQEGSSKA